MTQLETLTSPSYNSQPDMKLRLQSQMFRIRVLETKLQALCDRGELSADLHFSTGQEAIAVGVQAALRDSDYVVSHHRTIAHAVAKGVPLYGLVAELLGKADGINGGLAGEMHMSYTPKRFMFSFQLVGTCIPVAAGIAWAVKNHLKSDDIVVVFHGEAATANGQFHEGLNIAAVQRLPLLLVCENNYLAGNVRSEHYLPTEYVDQRAAAYGIESNTVDGNDVEAVLAAAEQAVAYVRRRSRPFFLVCDTTRLGKHKQGQGDLRSKQELQLLRERDPLRHLTLSRSVQSEIEFEIDSIIAQAQAGGDSTMPKEV